MFFLPQLAFFIVSMLVFRGAIMFEKRVTVPLIPTASNCCELVCLWAPRPKKTTWPIVVLRCRTSACGSQKSLWTMISLKWFEMKVATRWEMFGLGWMFGRWTVGDGWGYSGGLSKHAGGNANARPGHGSISKTCGFAAWKSPTNSCKVGS